ncbi:isopentenyl-diphosphate Delta-isomerase [Patescibacteria group bacterium]|nr:isopentenyl-diphosphate Delta-isomerase [Patescibacteria group bacterium]MBU1473076.1 isopentenyl-diphosphate Delta-isomerase [Patescibacteria group bacterium]MBU2460168.1 isopentenyl-diphosphate Delta-isomerase [Patescibacteria group bacterium]MBU2544484.1 isopentenyl-diphosphate Delta-isomerase [Patescibacteria group bacterium]
MIELVILVDEQNNQIGTAAKDTVHTKHTPLHRAFSLFLFNSKKELLITQRAKTKKTFPGVWTNTVCGHPAPEESILDAARRRLKEELGIVRTTKTRPGLGRSDNTLPAITEVTQYRYRFADKNGTVENEICPILVTYADIDPKPNPLEIDDWKWMPWNEFLKDIKTNKDKYSPWCREEAQILAPFI